jgi:hypothetical protein
VTIAKPKPEIESTLAKPNGSGWLELLRYHFAPLGLYLLGTLIFTFPLVTKLGDHIISPRSSDVWQHLWNIWWVKFSAFELRTHPFYTPNLFFPDGANLYYHALDPFDGYLTIPAQLVFGLVTAYNLQFWLQVTLAGYFAYLLARYLLAIYLPTIPNFGAALVAGVIYAYSPLLSLFLDLGQMELTAIEWLPLYILFFFKLLRNEPNLWRNRIACVILLIILSLSTWYYTMYAMIFSGLLVLYRLWEVRREGRKALLRVLLNPVGVIGVYGVIISPLLYLTLKDAAAGTTKAGQSLFILVYNSADIAGLFQPSQSVLWGWLGNPNLRGTFLGFIPLLLAGVGLVIGWKYARFWLGVAAVFLLLALGPVLHFRINPDWSSKSAEALQGVPLPGQLLYALPFGNIARVPLRFNLMVMLALAVCSALAVAWLQQRLSRQNLHPLVAVIAGLLVFLEFLPVPRVLVDTQIPPFFNQIRTEAAWNAYSLLHLPDEAVPLAMYYQTAHAHPIVGGYTSRSPGNYVFDIQPGVRMLTNWRTALPQSDIFDRSTLQNVPAVLASYKLRYVVVHQTLLNGEELAQINLRLKETFGEVKPYYQDAKITVYRTPEILNQPTTGAWQKIYQELGDGWGARDFGSQNGAVRRAINDKAIFSLTNPYQNPLEVELEISAQAQGQARNLQITLNNTAQPVQRIEPNSTTVKLRLKLMPGVNRLSFAPEGSGSPVWVNTIKVTGGA